MRPPADRLVALNVSLPDGAAPPEWVELLPSGVIEGRDGRTFVNDRPDDVVAAFVANRGPLPIDWEHASEIKAPEGEEAPAAGWIEELQNRAGQIWGRVAWTPRAAQQILAKEYRFLSPVFVFEKLTARVLQLLSAGLTNQPNLVMTALNRRADDDLTEVPMKRVLEALGLKPEATEEEAVTAVQTLRAEVTTAKAANSQAPSLDKYVPRADFDAAVGRAANAEKKLADAEKAKAEAEIDAAIGDALKAGRITPATVDYHKAQCRTEGGLERFKQFVKAAVAVGDPSGLDGKKPGGEEHGKALNAEQKKVCSLLGIPEAEYQKNVEVK